MKESWTTRIQGSSGEQSYKDSRTVAVGCWHSHNSIPRAFSSGVTAQIRFLGGWAVCLSPRGWMQSSHRDSPWISFLHFSFFLSFSSTTLPFFNTSSLFLKCPLLIHFDYLTASCPPILQLDWDMFHIP